MSAGPAASGPFFLAAANHQPGQRFCLYHAPTGPCRGAVLYAPPFAEEMNKARRMAALQARALAQLGYGVLQIDLYGCGDSSGDFGDARWSCWLDDLALGAAWLHQQLEQPLTLWGLRLGALLALDFARRQATPPAMLLWQPVLSGPQQLTQFLRLRLAAGMLGEKEANSGGDTATLRARLRDGEPLEIAGYQLAPALAEALDGLDGAQMAPVGGPVHWIEVAGRAGAGPSPATQKVAQGWRERGVDLDLAVVPGLPFWATQEISENAAVIDAGCAMLARMHTAGVAA
jgi:exosortase A-associated hydrolase 2